MTVDYFKNSGRSHYKYSMIENLYYCSKGRNAIITKELIYLRNGSYVLQEFLIKLCQWEERF